MFTKREYLINTIIFSITTLCVLFIWSYFAMEISLTFMIVYLSIKILGVGYFFYKYLFGDNRVWGRELKDK